MTEADELREMIGHLEGRIDQAQMDDEVRSRLWQACDDAMMWSWQNLGQAHESLGPVWNYFSAKDDRGTP